MTKVQSSSYKITSKDTYIRRLLSRTGAVIVLLDSAQASTEASTSPYCRPLMLLSLKSQSSNVSVKPGFDTE